MVKSLGTTLPFDYILRKNITVTFGASRYLQDSCDISKPLSLCISFERDNVQRSSHYCKINPHRVIQDPDTKHYYLFNNNDRHIVLYIMSLNTQRYNMKTKHVFLLTVQNMYCLIQMQIMCKNVQNCHVQTAKIPLHKL